VKETKKQVPVTIIIPAFNHERYIEQALLSAIDQDYTELEIIVIDDGSTDNTPSVIERVIAQSSKGRDIFFDRQSNKGLSRTLNIGLKMATGEFVQFLASDDAYLPAKTKKCAGLLETLPKSVAAIYCDGYIIDENNKKLMRFSEEFLRPFSSNTRKELLVANWIPAMGTIYRKDALLTVGGFDESLETEDYDLLLRLAESFNVISIKDPLFLYRRHSTNHSKNLVRMRSQQDAIIQKHEDLKMYMIFKEQIKARSIIGIVSQFSLLNCELIMRTLLRRAQYRFFGKR
jgi:glycosyltransferase involved in cell wall biosynthesis